MYKVKSLLLVCSLLPFFTSCDNEPENHELSPVEKSIILYADQTLDSLRFYTYDSWTVTPKADWISIEGKSQMDLKYIYWAPYLCRVFVTVEPNTTGQTRTGTVLVQSYEYAYSSPVVQLGLLKVSHPGYIVDCWLDEQSYIPDVAHYELTVNANSTSDYISFTVQNNWSLTSADDTPADWIAFDGRTSGLPGEGRVNLILEKNTDAKEERTATLRLTSGEVSNLITIRQLPAEIQQ